MRPARSLLLFAALTASAGACRAVLGIDPLEVVDGGTDAATDGAEAGGDVTVDTSADADAATVETSVEASAGEASVDAEASSEAEVGVDSALDAPVEADAATDVYSADAAGEADAPQEAETSVADAPEEADAGDASDASDASAAIAACVDAGMMGCGPCCEMTFSTQHMTLVTLAINDSCVCGGAQCTTQCSGTICPPGGGMPPPDCDMCFTSAVTAATTPACQTTALDCLQSTACAPVLQCFQACP